jgi:hypothetical protein
VTRGSLNRWLLRQDEWLSSRGVICSSIYHWFSGTDLGHRYLTIVVDHDTRRLVWAAVGRDKSTLHGFFDLLGEEQSGQIAQVSADGAGWIASVVAPDEAPLQLGAGRLVLVRLLPAGHDRSPPPHLR